MKTLTLTLDDEVYEKAMKACQQTRRSLPELIRDLMGSWRTGSHGQDPGEATLTELWAFVDSKPLIEGSVGPLNRDSLYERGLPGH
ncbi:MAG: hypothetical protein IPK22_07745 [Verrucomicrobiaceae bacterium]|nr:hypothetical protein [Verrucomicrobiaceae bacterium]